MAAVSCCRRLTKGGRPDQPLLALDSSSSSSQLLLLPSTKWDTSLPSGRTLRFPAFGSAAASADIIFTPVVAVHSGSQILPHRAHSATTQSTQSVFERTRTKVRHVSQVNGAIRVTGKSPILCVALLEEACGVVLVKCCWKICCCFPTAIGV